MKKKKPKVKGNDTEEGNASESAIENVGEGERNDVEENA